MSVLVRCQIIETLCFSVVSYTINSFV